MKLHKSGGLRNLQVSRRITRKWRSEVIDSGVTGFTKDSRNFHLMASYPDSFINF